MRILSGPWRLAIGTIAILPLLVVPLARAQTGGPLVAVPGGPPCNSSFNPYDFPANALHVCGIRTFLRTRVFALAGGGEEYDFNVDGSSIIYRIPPNGFDPLMATDQQLAYYQLPPRPSTQAGLQRWTATVAHARPAPVPPFLAEGAQPISHPLKSSGGFGTRNTPIWAGNYASGSTFTAVESDWTEMDYLNPSGCTYPANSVWAGLGGVNSNNLAQDGSASNVFGLTKHQMWTEVLPAGPLGTSVVATPGDYLIAQVNRQNGGFQFWVEDMTKLTYAGPFQSTSQYDGSTADAISEVPSGYNSESWASDLVFQYVSANLQPLGLYPYTSVTLMSASNHRVEHPGSWYTNGQQFNVYYDSCNTS